MFSQFVRCSVSDRSFDSLADEQLVVSSKNGNNEAVAVLVTRMLPAIRSIASGSSGVYGIDREDLIQEGLIGLLSAIRSFDSCREASFRTFAGVCISNSIRSAVRKTLGKTEIPLKAIVSIDDAAYLPSSHLDDPQNIIVGNEEAVRLIKHMDKQLSKTEHSVLQLYLLGDSYSVIAKKLSLPNEKSVDNALQRIRKKLKSFS